jgi:hypothetical protein
LTINELGDDWELFNCLFSYFKTDIFAEGKNLKPNKLFTQIFAKAFAHATEELHSHYTIVLTIIVMGHLNDVL